jgi:uridine kinase
MIDKIIKRDGRMVPFNREKIISAVFQAAVACGGRDRQEAERVTDEVLRMLEGVRDTRSYPTVEEVQDLVEKALIERGHARTAKAYILYRYEHALKRAGRESLTYSSDNIPYRKLWQALSWATDHECVTLEEISRLVRDGKLENLIRASEEFYEAELAVAAERILERRDELKIIIISGPSSSGKTTTTLKIREKLAEAGMTTSPLTVDNYFYDLEFHPRIGEDDYDYETPQALDLSLINDHLRILVEGGSVEVPHYDFKKGRRDGVSEVLSLSPGQILLMDSLHGLFPGMTESIPERTKFRLYVETLSTLKDGNKRYIRWADIRMLRRVVRDMQFRNYSPRATIRHWHLVRRSELRYITPALRKSDAIVNSFLPYELPIMKNRVEKHIAPLVEEFARDPEKQDAYERSVRVMDVFAQIPVVEDESAVPATSLFREFIGGSRLKY